MAKLKNVRLQGLTLFLVGLCACYIGGQVFSAYAQDIEQAASWSINENCSVNFSSKYSLINARQAEHKVAHLPEFIAFKKQVKESNPSYKVVFTKSRKVGFKVEHREEQCFWEVTVYKDSDEKLTLWHTFLIHMAGNLILIQSDEGDWQKLVTWRKQVVMETK